MPFMRLAQTFSDSRSIFIQCSAPFKEELNGWIGKLAVVSETVEGWLAVQARILCTCTQGNGIPVVRISP